MSDRLVAGNSAGSASQAYQQLVAKLRDIYLLNSAVYLLDWDERTQMPEGGAEHRSNQVSVLSRMSHELFTKPIIGDLLHAVEQSELGAAPESDVAVNVRETRRSYDRACRVPPELVEEIAKTGILSMQAWRSSRSRSDFKIFLPWLEKMIALKLREADCLGHTGNPYDALLDSFEPGETAEHLGQVLDAIRDPLIELTAAIQDSSRWQPTDILKRHYARDPQEHLARQTAQMLGFDFDCGRIDVSLHPFTCAIGPGDARMTTRYDEHDFGYSFFGVLHETGHALYDQGLPAGHYGTPRGEAVSLGIHESQSRLWENFVGRSRPFWEHLFPKIKTAFPKTLATVSLEQWYAAVNDVRPSLVRTEADEITYNLHIVLRFEIEQGLMNRSLKAADVPGVWKRKMRQYLGIEPPNDASGCLQDIHWSDGSFGYFPTYTLGNLYAAQFYDAARKQISGLEESFAHGNFRPLLDWLRRNVHEQGQRYRAAELVRRVTGQELSPVLLLKHLKDKASEIYGI